MNTGHIDFQTIAARALEDSERLVTAWLPDGERSGHEWQAINPTREDRKAGSFSVNLRTGAWGDFASDDKGGDLISLYAYLSKQSQADAARAVADTLGIEIPKDTVTRTPGKSKPGPAPAGSAGAGGTENPAKKTKSAETIIPVPDDVPPAPVAHTFRGVPDSRWAYRDGDGRLLGYVCRFTTSDGGKEVIPLTYVRENGACAWRWKAFSEPRPLYGLDRLAAQPTAQVLIVEGEKCADAAAAQLPGYACITWPSGSKAVGKVDWTQLQGRQCVLWPDCDAQRDKTGQLLPVAKQPGIQAMRRVAEALADMQCQVSVVEIPEPGAKPAGWDIADAIADGLIGADLQEWINAQARGFTGNVIEQNFNGDALSSPQSSRRQRKSSKRNGSQVRESDDKRPVIKLRAGTLPKTLDQIDQVLAEMDRLVYQKDGRLVVLSTVSTGLSSNAGHEEIKRPAGSVILRDLTPAHLRDRLARVAQVKRYDARAGDDVDCVLPRVEAESFLDRVNEWPHIPRLVGFVEAPTLRDDGSVLDEPGYDAQSMLYLTGVLPDDYERVPDRPDQSQASKALSHLMRVFQSLPFVDESDLAAHHCALFTALCRRLLPSAPMLAYTANAPGTGKSLAVDSISTVVCGRPAPVMAAGKNDDELQKRLYAALRSGDAVIAIDNIERPLSDDLLCQMLTQPSLLVRPLGQADRQLVASNAAVFATGNNLDIRGDMLRRVLLIRLDAKQERPEERSFDRDLLADVRTQRGKILTSCLTIMRAFAVTNGKKMPDGFRQHGGFEVWSQRCRAPLVWLGMPDPLRPAKLLLREDPHLGAMRELFIAWHSIWQDRPVKTSEIVNAATDQYNQAPALRAALEEIIRDLTPRALGNWLRKNSKRIVDGTRIEPDGNDSHSKVALWKLIQVAGSTG